MIRPRIRVPTSDHVELEFELAGAGSRFAALAIDFVLLGSAILTLWISLLLVLPAFLARDFTFAWGVALLILVSFLLIWGYFLLLEGLLRGRTPGKMLVGLRVLEDDGTPIGLRAAAIRNLLRMADLIPPPTGLLGGLCILVHPLGKRLGDMAAGTIVVRETFAVRAESGSSALWMERLERGASRQAVLLPGGQIDVGRLSLIERFLRRRATLPVPLRRRLAWSIAEPLLPIMGEDPGAWVDRFDREVRAEELLEKIARIAQPAPEASEGADYALWFSSGKREHWKQFGTRVGLLLRRGRGALRGLSPAALSQLLDDYRRVTADLARARSLGADPLSVDQVNRLAVQGHNLIYGNSPARSAAAPAGSHWLTAFARTFRRHPAAFAVSALLFALPAVVGYVGVQRDLELGYELVPAGFLEFSAAREDSLHDIPPLARPVAASSILTNNLQVSLGAFSLGLTGGLGTAAIMIHNGLHIGAVAGWMTRSGQQRALWGWVMPHGGTELLAIVIAGMAGCLLASAILSPGRLSRREALKYNALDALVLQLGCMAMLVVAGLIEGFVSPSHIPYAARIGVLAGSLTIWFGYLLFAGRGAPAGGGPPVLRT